MRWTKNFKNKATKNVSRDLKNASPSHSKMLSRKIKTQFKARVVDESEIQIQSPPLLPEGESSTEAKKLPMIQEQNRIKIVESKIIEEPPNPEDDIFGPWVTAYATLMKQIRMHNIEVRAVSDKYCDEFDMSLGTMFPRLDTRKRHKPRVVRRKRSSRSRSRRRKAGKKHVERNRRASNASSRSCSRRSSIGSSRHSSRPMSRSSQHR